MTKNELNSALSSFLVDSNNTRISIEDVIVPYDECAASIHGFTWFIICLSTLFWLFRVVRFFYHAVQYYDIKKFFNTALKIDDVSGKFPLSLSMWFEFPYRLGFYCRVNWIIIHGTRCRGAFVKCKRINKCAFTKKI